MDAMLIHALGEDQQKVAQVMKLSNMLLATATLTLLTAAAWIGLQTESGSAEPAAPAVKGDLTVKRMVDAARVYLDELSPELRKKSSLAFDDPMRLKWHYYPRVAWERSGAMLKELSPRQKDAFFAVLKTGTSATGFETVKNLMQLEAILREIENTPYARIFRDPERFHLTIFGTPALTGRWAWRLEGHHCILSYVIDEGKIVASTPFVLGANPGRVPSGPERGLRILPGHEDSGRALYTSLSPALRAKATFAAEPPFDVMTNADTRAKRLPKIGARYGDMTPEQKKIVDDLLRVYTGLQPPSVQEKLLAEITAAGRDDILFAWSGSPTPGEPHYYQVNGPNFLIEFCDAQNGGNHIHLVWRDYANDFGEKQ